MAFTVICDQEDEIGTFATEKEAQEFMYLHAKQAIVDRLEALIDEEIDEYYEITEE